ncbi:ATPase AAA [Candidatus Gastranaerophilus sp. (ex Termes propinquus)]|nr:ATPase AAA [Candidatus Gastranaerophilus sp. (ex Termes propinquus)]
MKISPVLAQSVGCKNVLADRPKETSVKTNCIFNDSFLRWPAASVGYSQISFGGKGKKIDKYDEKHCKNIINATAAICAGMSAASGEAAAFGVEPWLLRGTQGLMFIHIGECLEVPPVAATAYAARQYVSGAYWGCELSKMAVAGIALATEAATAGTATPVATGVVRGVNAGISAAITKKMGHGFLKSVKNGSMEDKEQLIRLGTYLTTKALLGGFDDVASIGDLDNSAAVKQALENAPSVQRELYAHLLDHMSSGASRAGAIFLTQLIGTKAIANAKKIPIDNDQLLKQSIKNAFVTTAVYELFDEGADIFISKAAVDTVIDISENMHNYPEVFKVFEEFQDETMKTINLEKINSPEFLKEFKNKAFLFEFSGMAGGKVNEFLNAWSKRRNIELNQTKNAQSAQGEQISKKQANAQKASEGFIKSGKQADIDATQAKTQEIIANLNKVNLFGYSKIAGYDEEKGFLKGMFNSLFNMDDCDSEDLPNSVLFFGPRGNGKTTFASAMAEEFGCRFRKVATTSDKEKAYKRLTKELNSAKEHWEVNKRNSIILVDECTAFMTPPKNEAERELSAKIAELMDESAEKYHATLFLTTNYPLKMDKNLVDYNKIALTMPLNPPSNKNMAEVLKHYTEKPDLDYEKIMAEFDTKMAETESRYSNGQIKDIVELTKQQNNGIITENNLIDTIRQTLPEITKDDLEAFELGKRSFEARGNSNE